MNGLGVGALALGLVSVALMVTGIGLSEEADVRALAYGTAPLVAMVVLSLITVAAAIAAAAIGLRAGYLHESGQGDNWADITAMWGALLGIIVVMLWTLGFFVTLFITLSPLLGALLGLAGGIGGAAGMVLLARSAWRPEHS